MNDKEVTLTDLFGPAVLCVGLLAVFNVLLIIFAIMRGKKMAKRGPRVVFYSPLWSQRLTESRVKRGMVIFTDLGREIRCSRCKYFLPADTECFWPRKDLCHGLDSWCRACRSEYDLNKRNGNL